MIAGDVAVRDWVNAQQATLTGPGQPLSNGAFLHDQASPQSGAYVVVAQVQGSADGLVAEQEPNLCTVSLSFTVHSMTQQAASVAAAALGSRISELNGKPEPCGNPGSAVTVLVSDNLRGPQLVPMPTTSGEEFTYVLTADFVLAQL